MWIKMIIGDPMKGRLCRYLIDRNKKGRSYFGITNPEQCKVVNPEQCYECLEMTL